MLDPTQTRFRELLDKIALGTANEAEREELEIYRHESPDQESQVQLALQRGAIGTGWLERNRRDEALRAVERAPRVRIERVTGVGLIGLGYVLTYTALGLGVFSMVAGSAVLLYSLLRTRRIADDPYEDIEQ